MESISVAASAVGICAAGGVLSWAAVAPSSQLFGWTIRRTGDASSMALTFDDGPNPAITPALLDLLDLHKARATFFVIGRHVRAVPALAKEIAERGHTIGNHTETHRRLVFCTSACIVRELDQCDEAIKSATGEKPRWMRPPFGYRNPLLDGVVRKSGRAGVVMWSSGGKDWKPQPAERVIERLRGAKGGDIVLLHDGDHHATEGDRRHTLKALEYWLPRWKDLGIRFITVDELSKQS